jgi:hypothetical protein
VSLKKFLEHFERLVSYYLPSSIQFEMNGFEKFKGIGVTKPLQVIKIKTNKFEIKASKEHILFTPDGKEILVKNLKLNDKIITINGIETIKEIHYTNEYEEMYDILDVSNEKYFTNGILSHNCGKCVDGESLITIRNKETGKIEEVKIEDLYNLGE